MKSQFHSAAKAAAEKFLRDHDVKFTPQADGSLYVPGSINLSRRNLDALPDLSMVDVGEEFFCDRNNLTSLAGAPRSVQGGVDCSENMLTSLKGLPKGCADLSCSDNLLTSLEGAPEKVSVLYCEDNRLTSLEHAPKEFTDLHSDFGRFRHWSDVPDHIRVPPETKQQNDEAAARAATILDGPLTVRHALKFRF